jgi:hypothetical protein
MLQATMNLHQSSLPDSLSMAQAVTVIYTNWRGETAERIIIPVSIRWGKTEWHPEEQWLLKVWDIERKAYREYAVKDITSWRS